MTKQRKKVLNLLQKSCKHLSADEIYSMLKLEGEKMVFATVYNSLNYLVENKYIRRLHVSSQVDRYDGNMVPHDHFVCDKCGTVIDIPARNINLKNRLLEDNFVESFETTYRGICRNCLKAKETSK